MKKNLILPQKDFELLSSSVAPFCNVGVDQLDQVESLHNAKIEHESFILGPVRKEPEGSPILGCFVLECQHFLHGTIVLLVTMVTPLPVAALPRHHLGHRVLLAHKLMLAGAVGVNPELGFG